jgi:hypothetical protein
VSTEEARQKLRELTALVEPLRQEAMLHPDDAEAGEAWRASCRDLDGAIAALAELLGDRENARAGSLQLLSYILSGINTSWSEPLSIPMVVSLRSGPSF